MPLSKSHAVASSSADVASSLQKVHEAALRSSGKATIRRGWSRVTKWGPTRGVQYTASGVVAVLMHSYAPRWPITDYGMAVAIIEPATGVPSVGPVLICCGECSDSSLCSLTSYAIFPSIS